MQQETTLETRERPVATQNCIVFVEDAHGKRFLAVVVEFLGGHTYTLAPYNATDGCGAFKWPNYIEDDDAMHTLKLSGNRDPAQEHWKDAPLPDCAVCTERTASAALPCKCTVPCVCPECAAKVGRCPQCRVKVDPRMWRFRHESNIFALAKRPCDPRPYQVFVKTFTDHVVTLQVFACWSVETLKDVYAAKTGMPPSLQRAIFGGRQLEGGRLLSDYGIDRESTVFMALRLSGD